MDHVEASSTDEPLQLGGRYDISHRIDGADQFRHQMEIDASSTRLVVKVPLRPVVDPAQKGHPEPGAAVLTDRGEQCVLLRAPDDETRDDMEDIELSRPFSHDFLRHLRHRWRRSPVRGQPSRGRRARLLRQTVSAPPTSSRSGRSHSRA